MLQCWFRLCSPQTRKGSRALAWPRRRLLAVWLQLLLLFVAPMALALAACLRGEQPQVRSWSQCPHLRTWAGADRTSGLPVTHRWTLRAASPGPMDSKGLWGWGQDILRETHHLGSGDGSWNFSFPMRWFKEGTFSP